MSSDRPYQSHLFTALHRTVQRAKDQAGLLWRNFKVSVTWGAQLALYPFYAVVKASRWAGKQLGQTWRSESFRFSAWTEAVTDGLSLTWTDRTPMPASDAPINTVLTALMQRDIAALPAGDADCLMISLAEGTKIQGVASILSTRRLALVTTGNQTLDILSASQQHELRQRIIYEIASYWRSMRSRRLPSSSPVAQLGSRVVKSLTSRFSLARLSGFQSTSIAKLQPVTPVKIPTLWTDRPGNDRSERGGDLNYVGSDRPEMTTTGQNLRNLPAIIQAALQHFFGGSEKMLPGDDRPATFAGRKAIETPVLTSVQLNAIAVDPWTIIPDAQLPIPVSPHQPTAIAIAIALPPANLPNLPSLSTLKNWIQSRLQNNHLMSPQNWGLGGRPPVAPSQIAAITPIAVTPIARTQPKATPIAQAQPKAAATATNLPTRAASTRVAHAPTWLETPAQSMGYQVSWIERLVLGLDRAIVFLEKLFLMFWNGLQLIRKSR